MTDGTTGQRNMGRRAAVRGAGLAALAGGLGMAAAASTASAQSSASGIIGTWRVRAAGGVSRQDVEVLFVFIPGGIFLDLDTPIEVTASPADEATATEYAGIFAGQWLQTPSGAIQAACVQFNYGPTGAKTSEERMDLTFTYDGATDTIRGTRQWRETAADGRLISSATGEVRGTRVGVTG